MRQPRRRPTHWTTRHDIDDREIALGASLWSIRGTLAITWDYDSNADCDADGTRGREQTSEDERHWTLLGASRCGHGGEWQAELLDAEIPPEVREAAERWAETCDPPDEEPWEDDGGPDYDREDEYERHARHHADDGSW